VVRAWPAIAQVKTGAAGEGDEGGDEQGTLKQESGTSDSTAEQTSAVAALALAARASNLTQKELDDPHCVDFIESNDVLDAEIKAASEALVGAGADEDERFALTLRLQLLQTKMQLLVYAVQTEALSLPDYLDKLRQRVRRDSEMALAFKALREKENISTALKIMRRINVMKQEIQNAEEGREGEEG